MTNIHGDNIKRSVWGTILGVLNILGLIALGLLIAFFIVIILGSTLPAGMSIDTIMPGMGSAILSFGWMITIPFIFAFAFSVIITVGVFKGWRWTIILSIIFAILGLVAAIFAKPFNVAPLISNAIVLGLAIMCIRDPYYSKKVK